MKHRPTYWRWLMLVFLSIALWQPGLAQKKVQVVTKTVSQKLEQKLDSGILIEGRKASVTVTGWEKDFALVEIDLISKHEDVDVALKEIDYIQYVISKTSTRYILKNSFFAKKQNTKIKSSLSVAYRVFVPMHTKVHIDDQYGEVELINLFGQVDLNVNFCEVRFERLFGALRGTSDYSEWLGKDFDGDIRLRSKKTEIELTNFAGQVDIDNNYGDISLSPTAMLQSMKVSSRHGKVDLQVNSMDAFNYNVKVNSSYIDLPSAESAYVTEADNGQTYRFERSNGLHKANISISNLLYPVKIYAVNLSNR